MRTTSVKAGSDNYFHIWCLYFRLYVRPSAVPTFQKLAKQNNIQAGIAIATGATVGLAEWIIDGTHVLSWLYV